VSIGLVCDVYFAGGRLENVFKFFDKNGDGVINESDFWQVGNGWCES
jgi:hypothetical protein